MKQYIITDLSEGLVNITEEQLLEIGGDSGIVEEFISKTFAELKAIATANELIIGQKYRVTNYMTTYTQPVTNVTKSSGILEVLQLTAITTNSFATECNSELYPQDIVYYDINNATEGFTKGKIFRRIDTLRNNDIGTDWRHVKYDRAGVDKLLFDDYTGVVNNTIKTYYLFNNVIGSYFLSNTIENDFEGNTIGNNCYSNTIGNFFRFNNIGDVFSSNTIGNNCYSNTIGIQFNFNNINKNCFSKTFPANYQSRTVYGNTAVFPTNTSATKMLVVDPITMELSEKLIPTIAESNPQATRPLLNTAFNTNDLIDGKTQYGKEINLQNTSAIEITVKSGAFSTYFKGGVGNIKFVADAGRTLKLMDATDIINGIVGSYAKVKSFGTVDYIYINNYE